MSTGAAIFCSVSSGLDGMKRCDQRDPLKVLRVLAARPRFSVFEATDNLTIARTLVGLKEDGFLVYPKDQPAYPWSLVELTDKGRAALADATEH